MLGKDPSSPAVSRRAFLGAGLQFGGAALAGLMARDARGRDDVWRGALPSLHTRPRAKRVIHLYMAGGPSHLETFDPKPRLARMDGQPMPESFTKGQPIAQLQDDARLFCFAPQFPFRRRGRSGIPVADAFPRIGDVADELCVIRSMTTEQINHDPAHTFFNSGALTPGRPSMGSWVLYGLGSECDDLPGFIVLSSSGGGQDQPIAARQWSAGFLPGRFQGVPFHSTGDPVLYLNRPPGVSASMQRESINTVTALDREFLSRTGDPEILTRISQYEMAFRMQTSVPELVDLSNEPAEVLDLYGTRGGDGSFAANCLLARRLAERGVRFIQVYHRGWDHHDQVKAGITSVAKHVDQATAALIVDLKRRGMLDDTLVLWGGEFGRTPMAQNSGRDHHIRGFSMFLAGGGVRAGTVVGATDELGYYATEQVMPVHDLHATVLHLLGVDHLRLTYRSQGRDFRLTDVSGEVRRELLA